MFMMARLALIKPPPFLLYLPHVDDGSIDTLICAAWERNGCSINQPDFSLGDAADLRQIHESRAPKAVETIIKLLFKSAQGHFHRNIR